MMTLPELKAAIAQKLDEVTILEMLDISADELVEAFSDKIEERFNTLVKEMDTEEWQS